MAKSPLTTTRCLSTTDVQQMRDLSEEEPLEIEAGGEQSELREA
jgi:hypothetical protein